MKVVELMASSSVSWEDAAQSAVTEASKTLHNIRSLYIKEQSAVVENGKVTEYRIIGKLSFELDRKQGLLTVVCIFILIVSCHDYLQLKLPGKIVLERSERKIIFLRK